MKIPKQFDLAGLTINIVHDTKLTEKNQIGEARYNLQEIALDQTAAPHDFTIQSFYHEKVHFILYIMGRDDLRNDEVFVDLFAHLLYQSDKSAVYA